MHLPGEPEPSPEALARNLGGIRNGVGWKARCPTHADDKASLAITEKNGRTVFYCHAGCPQGTVLAALQSAGHWPDKAARNPPTRIVATYDYQNEAGELVFQVVRHQGKKFVQRRPDGKGNWIWNMHGIPVLPYRLPEVLEAIANDRPVFVVEGEKDANNLAKLNIPVTCNAAGAGKWKAEHAAVLKGADLVILPDNDPPGRQHAESVARSLTGIAQRVRVLTLPDLPDKGDVSDWLEKGGTAEKLWQLAQSAPDWQPGQLEHAGTDEDEQGKVRSCLTFTLFRDIDTSPRKEWLCHNLFGAREQSCVFGQPGSCKSTLVGDAGAHVAAGKEWFGRRTIKGGVLYVAAERTDLVKRRMAAFGKHHGIIDMPLAVVSGQPDLRTSNADALQIIDCAKRLEDEFGIAVALIILETVSRLLAGGDENSSKDMGALVRMFSFVQEAITSAHIMAVHHMPADGSHRLRGHSLLLGACDTTARTEQRGPVRMLTTDKVNDGPEGEAIAFTLQSVELSTDGDIKTTAPVVVPAAAPTQTAAGPNLTRNQQTMFYILHTAGSAGLTTEEWNGKARDAGLGVKRKADLYDLRAGLKGKDLVREWSGKWIVQQ